MLTKYVSQALTAQAVLLIAAKACLEGKETYKMSKEQVGSIFPQTFLPFAGASKHA